jgi:hypothetical protein
VPFHVPLVIVPTPVSEEPVMFDGSATPDRFAALVPVAKTPNEVPPVFVQVIAPAFVIAQSPDICTAVAVPACPIQNLSSANVGREKVGAAHVLSPRRKVVAEGVPVTAVILLVPILVSDAPEPLKVVPATVPVIEAPPADTVKPPAVIVNPPLLTVGPVMVGVVIVGDVENTKLVEVVPVAPDAL